MRLHTIFLLINSVNLPYALIRTDHRRYNLPTASSNEIAVIVPGDGDLTRYRDIVLHQKDAPLEKINECNPWYHTLHYVLLFPTGQLG